MYFFNKILLSEFIGSKKNKDIAAYIIYFSLSLFSIMSSEFLTSLKITSITLHKNDTTSNIIYILYSFSVSVGILLFYFFKVYIKSKKTCVFIIIISFFSAIVLMVVFIFSIEILLIQIVILLLFTIAGFNTGIASYILYKLYQKKYPAGKILAVSSFLGLMFHYIFCFLINQNKNASAFLGTSIIISIAIMIFIIIKKINILDDTEEADETVSFPFEYKNYVILLISITAVIVVISFIIGISDYLVAKEMPLHIIISKSFFYPVLFYIPGQVIACLLADFKKGKYLPVTVLAGAIILVPVTLFLESPNEFYLNSGINFFIGGFFLAYIMTVMISNIRPHKNKVALICLSGFIYSLFCGIGALAAHFIFIHMNVYFILTGYSLLIIVLIFSIFVSIFAFYKNDLQNNIPNIINQTETEPNILNDDILKEYSLTVREREIIPYLVSTMTTEEISAELYITVNTLKTHIRNVLRKTDSSSRRELRRILTEKTSNTKQE